jgi:hypothetical protein
MTLQVGSSLIQPVYSAAKFETNESQKNTALFLIQQVKIILSSGNLPE